MARGLFRAILDMEMRIGNFGRRPKPLHPLPFRQAFHQGMKSDLLQTCVWFALLRIIGIAQEEFDDINFHDSERESGER